MSNFKIQEGNVLLSHLPTPTSRKMFFILEVLRQYALPLLTDSLQPVFSTKPMWLKWNKIEFFPSRGFFGIFALMGLKKTSFAYDSMARSADRKLFWAPLISEF